MKQFIWPVRVYYEDTDSGGVVYYANYLKFMERARTEWLRSLGFEPDALAREQGVVFMVRSVDIRYRRPARFNDFLEVYSRVAEVRGASLVFEQTVRRVAQPAEPLCQGWIRVACVQADSLKPKPLPGALLMEIVGDR